MLLSKNKGKAFEKKFFTELRSLCTAMEILNRENTQETKWDKIFVNYISDKELIPEYISNLKT